MRSKYEQGDGLMKYINCVNAALVIITIFFLCFSGIALENKAVTLTMERSYSGGGYPSGGGSIDITVTWRSSGTGMLLALSLAETIPSGWTFSDVVSGAEPDFVVPSSGSSGTLDFAWNNSIPTSFPASFTYRLSVPSGDSGSKCISGVTSYNGGQPDDQQLSLTSNVPVTEGEPSSKYYLKDYWPMNQGNWWLLETEDKSESIVLTVARHFTVKNYEAWELLKIDSYEEYDEYDECYHSYLVSVDGTRYETEDIAALA